MFGSDWIVTRRFGDEAGGGAGRVHLSETTAVAAGIGLHFPDDVSNLERTLSG